MKPTEKKQNMQCEFCKKRKSDTSVRNCGYHEEISGTEVEETICDECEQDHLMDI